MSDPFSQEREKTLLKKLSTHLNELMARERLKSSEFGRRIGLPASTIKKIRNCETPNPTIATLLPIASYFSLTLSQLVGDEDMPLYNAHGGLQKVPILSWKSVLQYPDDEAKTLGTISLDPPESPSSYALIVEESHLENFPQGTILIVNPDIQPKHNDYVIIHKNGSPEVYLKQWIDNQNEIYLKTLITGCPFAPLTSEHRVLGVVTEYRKRLGGK